MLQLHDIIIISVSLVLFPFTAEQTSYEQLEHLINRYAYAMDPEEPGDKSLITDLPNLYSDALETYAAKESGVMNGKIACLLLIGIFKNYANIIKDKLATSEFPHISTNYVASTANWSTWLLEITLEKAREKDLDIFTIKKRVCDEDTKTPLELACALMLHRPMAILTGLGEYDTEQLYNCLLLSTVSSDTKGFDIIWQQLCHIHQCTNGCKVARKTTGGAVLSKGLRNIRLSILDVAYFQCKRAHLCIMFEHLCKVLCHALCSQQFADVVMSTLDNRFYEQQLICPYGYMHVIHGYHGWRTGFTMETSNCQVPSVDISQLSEGMLELFVGIKQPLLIKGVGGSWKLFTKWTRKHLQDNFGTLEVLGGSIPYGEIFREPFGLVTIEEYLLYMDRFNDQFPPGYYARATTDQGKTPLPFYVFDSEVMLEHFMMDYAIPAVFKVWNATEHHQFILGPPGSGAPFHFHCPAVNFLTYGRKRWLLTPPGISVYSKLHPVRLYSNQRVDILSQLKPLECMQHAGDMLYVPSGWGHATINVDESIGFAVEFELPNC